MEICEEHGCVSERTIILGGVTTDITAESIHSLLGGGSGCIPAKELVPLARALSDMTVSFREQITQLANPYSVDHILLDQGTTDHLDEKRPSKIKYTESAPAPHASSKSPFNPAAHFHKAEDHLISLRGSNDRLLTDHTHTADIHRVVVERIMKCEKERRTSRSLYKTMLLL